MKDVLSAIVVSSVLLVILFMLIGCGTKTVYVDRPVEVKVPVKCKAPEVYKAEKGDNDASTLLNIIMERDELREAIKSCN